MRVNALLCHGSMHLCECLDIGHFWWLVVNPKRSAGAGDCGWWGSTFGTWRLWKPSVTTSTRRSPPWI